MRRNGVVGSKLDCEPGVATPFCKLTSICQSHMSGHMIERTTIRLPGDLLNRAKRKAAAEGRTVTSLLEEGLRLVIAENRRPGRVKRRLPPTSKATGGLMPGVDMTKLAALEELDDLEQVERMKRFK